MFTDKRHSKRGIFSCVLGAGGLFSLICSVARIYAADGVVQPAQTISLTLAFIYGLAGLGLGIWVLVRGDTFRLFPALGTAMNALLLLCLTGLLVWGWY